MYDYSTQYGAGYQSVKERECYSATTPTILMILVVSLSSCRHISGLYLETVHNH